MHGAAMYKIGITGPERDQMFDANVRGTARVLDAAIEANVPRIVYVSSVVAFGDTEGATVTEETFAPTGLLVVLRGDQGAGPRDCG